MRLWARWIPCENLSSAINQQGSRVVRPSTKACLLGLLIKTLTLEGISCEIRRWLQRSHRHCHNFIQNFLFFAFFSYLWVWDCQQTKLCSLLALSGDFPFSIKTLTSSSFEKKTFFHLHFGWFSLSHKTRFGWRTQNKCRKIQKFIPGRRRRGKKSCAVATGSFEISTATELETRLKISWRVIGSWKCLLCLWLGACRGSSHRRLLPSSRSPL